MLNIRSYRKDGETAWDRLAEQVSPLLKGRGDGEMAYNEMAEQVEARYERQDERKRKVMKAKAARLPKKLRY